MKDKTKLIYIFVMFVAAFFMPVAVNAPANPVIESLLMLKDYVRNHMLFGLFPAFFIAGAITVFIKNEAVIKYFGAGTNKFISYSVASISGIVLTVCSCTILPVFSGIYKKGAGLGPAMTFLYSGPAINLLAIILSFKVLGVEIGIARAVGALFFSVIVGLMMSVLFREEDRNRTENFGNPANGAAGNSSNLWKLIVIVGLILSFMVTAGAGPGTGIFLIEMLHANKRLAVFSIMIMLSIFLSVFIKGNDARNWFRESISFISKIVPLLFIGILIAGFLFGRPGSDGLVPSRWIVMFVGGNSLAANFIASIIGAFMYFCTLVEIPVVQGLIGSGMGKGPALALLLAGPALSLPNMLVTRSILGTKKTIVYICMVVVLATLSGVIFGRIV